MTKLSDETLMLFADGQLGRLDAERVAKIIDDDPQLQARVQVFRATGSDLSALFDDHLNAPVPAQLLRALATPESQPSSVIRQRADDGARKRRTWPRWAGFARPGGAAAALAASVALVAGFGAGWLLRGGPPVSAPAAREIVYAGNEILATGTLRDALEATPSRHAVSYGNGAQLEMKMTFRNEAGSPCRQYEITGASHERRVGVACRDDGRWLVLLQAITPPAPSGGGQIVPATGGANVAVDAAVGALMQGDPVTAEEETALLRSGWGG